jgi:glutamine amidotransferase
MGNLNSISNMLRKIGFESKISSDYKEIEKADKLILPGVGAFDKGISNLREIGIIDAIKERVLIKKIPILGICLGMQLMTKKSEEGVLEVFR